MNEWMIEWWIEWINDMQSKVRIEWMNDMQSKVRLEKILIWIMQKFLVYIIISTDETKKCIIVGNIILKK